MLVKYYGLAFNDEKKSWFPRADFISNGFFRMTQPKYLNDKGSEARLWPYFNQFSPADYAWARREYYKLQANLKSIPSDEFLESLYLKPRGLRYGDNFPHLLKEEGLSSMDEYDERKLDEIARKINSILIESLSCQLGVFSLSKSDTNELMWTHYASEGKGLAVTFHPEHSFFKQFVPRDVTYSPDKRASLTYYKGAIRINGMPLHKFHSIGEGNSLNFLETLYKNDIDMSELSERLLYSKSEKWASENEVRIICPLSLCEKKIGALVSPDIDIEILEKFPHALNSYSEINLKKIPFDAFDSIVFGYDMSNESKKAIFEMVRKNKELNNIRFRVAKHNIFGEIEVSDF